MFRRQKKAVYHTKKADFQTKKADFQTKMVYSQTIENNLFRAIIAAKMGHIIHHSIALEKLDFFRPVSRHL